MSRTPLCSPFHGSFKSLLNESMAENDNSIISACQNFFIFWHSASIIVGPKGDTVGTFFRIIYPPLLANFIILLSYLCLLMLYYDSQRRKIFFLMNIYLLFFSFSFGKTTFFKLMLIDHDRSIRRGVAQGES